MFRRIGAVVIICGSGIGYSASVVTLIKLLGKKESGRVFLLLIPLFLLILVTTVGVILGFGGGMGFIYRESKRTLETLKSQSQHFVKGTTWREKREWRRFLRSCGNLRMAFGSVNFVEEGSPLKFLDFANSLATHMLLLMSPVTGTRY